MASYPIAGTSGTTEQEYTIPLDEDGLYILLSRQSASNKWHWGLYIHGTPEGRIFHITNRTNRSKWVYETRRSGNVIHSLNVAAALKVAVVEGAEMQDAVRQRIGDVRREDTERFGALTCRTWLLRVLDELSNEGYIGLPLGRMVEDIEAEAVQYATEAAILNQAVVRNSEHSF